MSNTFVNTNTSTYSEARARYVMGKVHEDLIGLTNRRLMSIERANRIKSYVLYLLNMEALNFFQLQFKNSKGGEIGGLHYKVYSGGYISADEDSGNIDYWALPGDTRVTLLINLDYSSKKIDEVNKQLDEWGFGSGNALTGTKSHLKTYSKDNYGLEQSKIGDW